MKNLVCGLILCLGAGACAVSDPELATDEPATTEAASLEAATSPSENVVIGDKLRSLETTPTTNANGNGQYCFNQCTNNVWYVNARITVNCASYGQDQVCPNRGLGWRQADWCNPSAQTCPSPAVLL